MPIRAIVRGFLKTSGSRLRCARAGSAGGKPRRSVGDGGDAEGARPDCSRPSSRGSILGAWRSPGASVGTRADRGSEASGARGPHARGRARTGDEAHHRRAGARRARADGRDARRARARPGEPRRARATPRPREISRRPTTDIAALLDETRRASKKSALDWGTSASGVTSGRSMRGSRSSRADWPDGSSVNQAHRRRDARRSIRARAAW